MSKIAAVLLVSSLLIIVFSVDSVFRSSGHEAVYVNNVDKFYQLLTGPNSKMTVIEGEQLNNDEREVSKWIKLDKQHFSLQLPDSFVPQYKEVYLAFYKNSPITCGKVAFSSLAKEWKQFITSRRSEVALMFGDEQLTAEEFARLYSRVCQNL